MIKNILPHAVSLALMFGAARADVPVSAPVTTPDAEPVLTVTKVESTAVEVAVDPAPEVCTGLVVVEPVPVKTEVADPALGTGGVEVVTCDKENVTVNHYSGSAVERGGEVDPVLMYSSGVMTLGGAGGGVSNLEQGIAGTGMEAAAALKIDVTEIAKPARELKVSDKAGDIVISD